MGCGEELNLDFKVPLFYFEAGRGGLFPSNTVCKAWAPPKANLFAWEASMGSVLTLYQLGLCQTFDLIKSFHTAKRQECS